MAEVIALTAGKGGMGTTALCAAIAANLAGAGKRVLCIDCDDGLGDLDAYLGLGQLPDLSYPEVCRGLYSLSQATVHPKLPLLRFLAAPMRDEQIPQAQMEALLEQARKQYDYILLDHPKYNLADRWLLVTLPDPAAIRGARRKADALEVVGANNVRMIVNAIEPKEMAAMGLTVDDVMDQVGLPLLGIVPRDSAVSLACAKGKLLCNTTQKGAAAAMLRITARIKGIHAAIPGRL